MTSVLNPEAPEFHPTLTSVTQEAYTTVNKSIRSSNHFPSGASYNIFKTFTDFNVVTSKISDNVIKESNLILSTEFPSVRLRRSDHEYNLEKVVDANDVMLDRVNINIDSESGVNRPSNKFLESVRPRANVSSWNNAPVIAKIQVGSTTFIGAKNIPRPQLMFKDKIDNSESLWVPKISDKQNNIKPLSLNILYNDDGEAIGYEHPYQVELELYQPLPKFMESDPSPPQFPPPLPQTPYTYVDTEEQIDALVEHLTQTEEFAVDLEHHSYRTYQGITCLIQISTSEGDFIIDALAAREHVHKLNLVFTDPRIMKIFHGADSDVLWLQRDFGVYIVGLFDTHQAAKALRISGLSLKYLLKKYCDIDADKKYQLADWRIRPLPEELVEYARMDTHYLIYIWRRMKAELLDSDGGNPRLLQSVIENSRQLCTATYNKEVIREDSHMPLYIRSKKSFNSRQMTALSLLYKWRDANARSLDESTTYLLPNHMLLSLCEALPREVQGVTACCSPMPPFVKQSLVQIHRMLVSCREMPLEPQLYPVPAALATSASTPQVPLHTHELPAPLSHPVGEEVTLDNTSLFTTELNLQPQIAVFQPPIDKTNIHIVSDLNAEAKLFIPPYDRYRKYRILAQMEEIKEYKEKEAKISAISKGDPLIKREVLDKLQHAQMQIEIKLENGTDQQTTQENDELNNDKELKQNAAQRKRKISEKERKDTSSIKTDEDKNKNEKTVKNSKSETNSNFKPFSYKNVNYKKFYEKNNTHNKHAKITHKKRK